MLTEKFLSRSEFEKIIDDTFNDAEGQQFFKFYGIFTEPELLAIIFNEEEEK